MRIRPRGTAYLLYHVQVPHGVSAQADSMRLCSQLQVSQFSLTASAAIECKLRSLHAYSCAARQECEDNLPSKRANSKLVGDIAAAYCMQGMARQTSNAC